MNDDITEYFISIIRDTHTLDMAETEFRRHLSDDEDLRKAYRNWCHENGTTEKRGFSDFCEEYLDGQNDVWNSLTDYDE